MALPADIPMAGYFIYRDTNSRGNPYDPAALEFYPPKDSDELFDALRSKYPHIKSHAERMRDAVIEFLIQERQAEQLPTPQTQETSTTTSPWQPPFPSMCSESSNFSSPETLALATPTFTNSPQPPHLNRQFSTETSVAPSSEPSPPALDQMTGVFSLSDSTQPKQRIRRKMTEAEKVEYRKRRIAKACEKCSKRKRKCHHNQADVETMASTKSNTHKIAKPITSAGKKPTVTATQEPPPDPGADAMDFASMFSVEMPDAPQFDDFTGVMDDPFPDMNFDDLLQFDHLKGFTNVDGSQQWPWSQTQDWTLMESPTEAVSGCHLLHKAKLEHELDLSDGQLLLSDDDYGGMNQFPPMNQYPAYLTGIDISKRAGGLQHSCGPSSGGDSSSGGSDNGMLWEHLRTGQPTEKQQPTHTPHVHAAEGSDSYVFDSAGGGCIGVKGPQCPKTSLAQMTLRLTGTAKAVRAFGNLLQQRSPAKHRIQSTSLGRIAVLALAGLTVGQQHDSPRTSGFLLGATQTSGPVHQTAQPTPALLPNSFFRGKQPKQENSDGLEWFDEYLNNAHPAEGPLEGMTIGDYLRMKTNLENADRTSPASPLQASVAVSSMAIESSSTQDGASSGRASTSVPVTRRTQKEFGTANLQQGATSKELASTSAPVSSDSLLRTNGTAQEGRSMLSLGEGITQSANPSVELFMLKRRIPKALHSIVDRDNTRVPTPLLQTETPSDAQTGALIRGNTLRTAASAAPGADGGAYLLADPNHCNHPDALWAGGDQPVHTRPRISIPIRFDGENDQNIPFARSSGTAIIRLIQARQLAERVSNTSGFVREQLVDLEEERLSDHVRRRDHFGRPNEPRRQANWAEEFLRLVAGLGCLLFVLSIPPALFLPASLNLTPLVLALTWPVSMAGAPGSKRKYYSKLWHLSCRIWDALMECMVRNKSRVRRGVHQLSLRRKDLASEARVWRGGARGLEACLRWNRDGVC